MSLREEQSHKVCRILDDVLANRPTERDALCTAVKKAFEALSQPEQHIDADGTLWVTVDDISKVGRVIVDDEKSKFCKTFYQDAQPEQKWIPVTENTLPDKNRVVVVCGEIGTWDYGTYRGHHEDNIHFWDWKKNTYKRVYWWMYKEDAFTLPYQPDAK